MRTKVDQKEPGSRQFCEISVFLKRLFLKRVVPPGWLQPHRGVLVAAASDQRGECGVKQLWSNVFLKMSLFKSHIARALWENVVFLRGWARVKAAVAVRTISY